MSGTVFESLVQRADLRYVQGQQERKNVKVCLKLLQNIKACLKHSPTNVAQGSRAKVWLPLATYQQIADINYESGRMHINVNQ